MTSPPSIKGRFGFRLGTTSFVLADDILPNVRFLGPLVDEIELVWFEGPPCEETLRDLPILARDHGLRYNVHLPLDLFVGDPDLETRSQSLDKARRCLELAMPLDPTCLILHLENRGPDRTALGPDLEWLERIESGFIRLAASIGSSELLAVENTDFPLVWVEEPVRRAGGSFCLDLGHLAREGSDLSGAWQRFGDRTIMIHAYGLRPDGRHGSLRLAPKSDLTYLSAILAEYRGGLSLEVFDLESFTESVQCLRETIKGNDASW
ncbi:MAG: sugar phosphate isomerase/epimerase [Deltaproteobacteria bacterium]|nr:sugar phosphate isomerase/epimerase [Deltaproteobacteria bacterium]